MERYSEYKDSGVKWLGEIPSHWEFVAAKKLYLTNDGGVWGTDPTGTDDTIVIRSTEQDVEGNLFLDNPARRHLTNSEINKALLKENDLIITKSSGSINHIGKTSLIDKEIATRKCCFSNFIQRIHLKGNAKFYWYVFNNKLIKDQFAILSSTTTGLNNISSEIINNILLPLLPFEEQDSIVSYLDSVTSKIDRAIAQQQRMIELLNERKQIIINNAVTKGLDPNVPMKDSGVEWIGMIPKHWEVRRAKYIFRIVNDLSKSGEEELLSVSDRTGVTPRSMKNVNMFMSESLIGYKRCQVGDICCNVMWMWHGAVGVTEYEGVISPSYCVYRQINKRFINEYLDNLLRIPLLVKLYSVMSTGLTESRLRLYPSDFLDIFFFIPPIDEQKGIMEFISNKCKPIEDAIVRLEGQISLLQERKQIIINDVVTGKVKVV